MQYPLDEKIGPPELLVGRANEFAKLDKWLNGIPRKISKSRVILARRKSGKTSFVQRIFNQLWSQNGQVIPFYFDIADEDIWYPAFAIKYYTTFASQYISFLERAEQLVRQLLSLEQIRAYGVANGIDLLVDDVDGVWRNQKQGYNDLIWETAYMAPHRHASVYDRRFLVIVDEFQNIASHIYRDEACATEPNANMPGSFHSPSESKVAPMLVTGSYIGIGTVFQTS